MPGRNFKVHNNIIELINSELYSYVLGVLDSSRRLNGNFFINKKNYQDKLQQCNETSTSRLKYQSE